MFFVEERMFPKGDTFHRKTSLVPHEAILGKAVSPNVEEIFFLLPETLSVFLPPFPLLLIQDRKLHIVL